MPLYRRAGKVILFIHIPKTGGSTVEEVLEAAGAMQALKTQHCVKYSSCAPQHMHWRVLEDWFPAGFYDYSMAVVRNPFMRLVSEYRYRERLRQRDRPLDGPILDFDSWVVKQFTRYKQDNYVLGNHIRPQSEFIGPGVEVFRLEDGLKPAVQACLTQLGMFGAVENLELHHALKSTHSPLQAAEQTLSRIAEFYDSDFKSFGYTWSDLPRDMFSI